MTTIYRVICDGRPAHRTEYETEGDAVEAIRREYGWAAVALSAPYCAGEEHGREVYGREAYASAEALAAAPDGDPFAPRILRVTGAEEETPALSPAAAACVEEAGVDVDADVAALRDGRTTPAALLRACLDGADDARVQGWREYVAAVCDAAEVTP